MRAAPIRQDVRCTYRGCDAPAISQFATIRGGLPWYACDDHAAPMMSAMGVGLPQSYSVEVADLSGQLELGG